MISPIFELQSGVAFYWPCTPNFPSSCSRSSFQRSATFLKKSDKVSSSTSEYPETKAWIRAALNESSFLHANESLTP